MENFAPLTKTKTIRVSYCDPDATDSSSDEESERTQQKSKRKFHEIEVEFVQKSQQPGNFAEETKSGKFEAEIRDPIKKGWVWVGLIGTAETAYATEESMFQRAEQSSVPTSAGKKIVGVRQRQSGKFCAEIRNPISRRRVWLGTFNTEEEASMAYLAKKSQFDKLRPKPGIKKSVAPTGDAENKVSGDEEAAEFGYFNGVQVVDKNGFLVGEFSRLDDLSICSEPNS